MDQQFPPARTISCDAGCGKSASIGGLTLSPSIVTPDGWVTVILAQGSAEPPHLSRLPDYSAVCCSVDCSIAFILRQHRLQGMAVTPPGLPSVAANSYESRGDVALRLGELLLEAIEEVVPETMVLLPIRSEDSQLDRHALVSIVIPVMETENLA